MNTLIGLISKYLTQAFAISRYMHFGGYFKFRKGAFLLKISIDEFQLKIENSDPYILSILFGWVSKKLKYTWKNVILTLLITLQNYSKIIVHFETSIQPPGSLVFHPSVVRPFVCGPSLNISETANWFFLIFCMKLGHQRVQKWQSPIFEKKSWGVTNGGKPPFWGHFWCFLSISLHPVIKSFWNFIYIISSTLSNI